MDRDDERIDINLDEEPVGDSALEKMLADAAAAAEGPPDAEEWARHRAEKDELQQALVRLQADFENYRKRIDRERKEDVQRATTLVIEGLLPVIDAFERALSVGAESAETDGEEYRKGFELIYRQLLDGLGRLGLERIEAAGKPFDPHYHQAIESVASTEHQEGTVIEELQTGYKLRDRVLRPSMVRVTTRPPASDLATLTSIT